MSRTSRTIFLQTRIETPENISFTYELAGPGTRMIAFMIDFIIQALAAGVLSFIIGNMALGSRHSRNTEEIITVILLVFNIILMGGGLFLFFEYLMNGSSPGKSALGIRVLRENGAPPSFQDLTIRNIFRLIDCFLPFQYAIGGFMMIFSTKGQRLGDIAAGTIVVKEKSDITSARYRWRIGVQRSVFKKDVHLEREDFDYLMEYVDLFRNFPTQFRNRISLKLALYYSMKYKLHLHEDFAPMVKELHDQSSLIENPVHRRAENIFKRLLEIYALQNRPAAS